MAKRKKSTKIEEIIDRELNVIRGDGRPKTADVVTTKYDNEELYRKSNPGPDIYGIKWPGAYKSYGSYGNPITDYGDSVSKIKVQREDNDMVSDIPESNADLIKRDSTDEFDIDTLKEDNPQVARLFGLLIDEITSDGLSKRDIYNMIGLFMETMNVKDLPNYYKKRLMHQMIENNLTDSIE